MKEFRIDETRVFIRGRDVLPTDGMDHPIETGDVVIVEAGEHHRVRGSSDAPPVSAWRVMAPQPVGRGSTECSWQSQRGPGHGKT